MKDSLKDLGQVKSFGKFLDNWIKDLRITEDLTQDQIDANLKLAESVEKVADALDDVEAV